MTRGLPVVLVLHVQLVKRAYLGKKCRDQKRKRRNLEAVPIILKLLYARVALKRHVVYS